jgi:hypothetical protein
MREIVNEHQAKRLGKLGFCYVCGELFTDINPSTHDHVPPRKIFRLQDRSWPLILPAHKKCNAEYSMTDEQAKGLIALLHPESTKRPPINTKIVGIAKRDGKPSAILLRGLKLGIVIAKILKACHAALYGDFLPSETPNKILMPLPEFDLKTHDIVESTFLPQHEILSKLLKDNRKLKNVDRIHANNGKFRFEVVWATSDDGRVNFAAFGIDLYSWHKLGGAVLGRPQGCFGTYRIKGDTIPEGASIYAKIELPYTYGEPLNPFEEFT